MDLFTVDTVGEQTLVNQDKIQSSDILYSYSKDSEITQNESQDEDSNSDIENEEDTEDKYDYGGKNIKTFFGYMTFNIFKLFAAGIPPPSIDIISILKNPTLFNKPLYGNDESTSKKNEVENDLNAFFKALGWTSVCGVLPKKSNNKSRPNRLHEDYLSGVHEHLTKTDISKEMSSCVLKGIQTKRELKIPSEREAHRQRKVCIRFEQMR